MGKLRVLLVFFMAAVVVWCFVPNMVSAGAPPGCNWSGLVEVNGAAVPAGTVVSAWINGVKWAETATGPGQQGGQFMITVPADNPCEAGIQGGQNLDEVFFKIKRSGDTDWLDAKINGQEAGLFFADTWYWRVLLSVEISPFATVEGQVRLQGRPEASGATWVTPLTVKFFEPGTNNLIRTENVTTDDQGKFTVADVETGTYDIGVKCPRSLSELASGVGLAGGAIVPVDFGTLREGDANNDDAITGADYAFLHTYFWQTSGEALEKSDFNRDGQVNGLDYSLLWGNFSQVGDMNGMWP